MSLDDTAASQDSSLSLIELLKSCKFNKENCDITVTASRTSGTIHIRNGVVLSAHAGILHGNGALLSLAQLRNGSIVTKTEDSPIQKTVFLSVDQVTRYLSNQKNRPASGSNLDEEQILDEAKNLLFRFHYKEAVDKLISILRNNRFFYPAWLWQSRLLTRQDYISRALDEAYRWGNHDQDVWRESRKMRPQISHSEEPVKRCIFCWSILSGSKSCSNCKARFSITAVQASQDLRKDDVQYALNGYQNAHQKDPKNAKVLFALALGYFNLGELEKSKLSLEKAVALAPQTALYTKSLSLLNTIIKAYSANQQADLPTTAVEEKRPQRPQILMVEDSMTSRKVLSMLLKKYHLHLLEAATGQEALALASSQRPQLILLDLMLPDANGHDLLSEMRKLEHLKDVPVIMLTGRHDAKDRLRGIQGGAQEYVTKPFNPQKLTSLIQSYLKVESKPQAEKKSVAAPKPARSAASRSATFRPPPAAAQGRPAVMQPPAKKTPAQKVVPQPGSKTILVIEDSRTSRKVLTMLLNRHGYTLYEAESGKEALELAPTISPDLVLLDVMLPDMTGYTVLPKLRELDHYAKLPFVMLTGNKKATDRLQGMLAGTNEYITKPFDPQKLLGVIQTYI